jgi:hypothetical protein
MRGYTIPTSTVEKYSGPAAAYGPSPLAQISGLGSLLGSGFNTQGGWGNKLFGKIGNVFDNFTLDSRVNMPSDITRMEYEGGYGD